MKREKRGPLDGGSRAAWRNRVNAGMEPRPISMGGCFYFESTKLLVIPESAGPSPRRIVRSILRARAAQW